MKYFGCGFVGQILPHRLASQTKSRMFCKMNSVDHVWLGGMKPVSIMY